MSHFIVNNVRKPHWMLRKVKELTEYGLALQRHGSSLKRSGYRNTTTISYLVSHSHQYSIGIGLKYRLVRLYAATRSYGHLAYTVYFWTHMLVAQNCETLRSKKSTVILTYKKCHQSVAWYITYLISWTKWILFTDDFLIF